jgi:hypothetical protein
MIGLSLGLFLDGRVVGHDAVLTGRKRSEAGRFVVDVGWSGAEDIKGGQQETVKRDLCQW